MSYEYKFSVDGWDLSHDETAALPYRLAKDNSNGEFFKDLYDVVDYIHGAGSACVGINGLLRKGIR